MRFAFAISLIFVASTSYSAARCSAIFAGGLSRILNYETLSDPKKLSLIEKQLRRALSDEEKSILLDVIHLQLGLPPDKNAKQANDPYYQIKRFMSQSILPDNEFDALYSKGVLSSQPAELSQTDIARIIAYGQSFGLSASDVKLIHQYTADYYFDINRSRVNDSTKQQLRSALLKLPSHSGTLYRSAEARRFAGTTVGMEVETDSFWSTSTKKDVTEDWRDDSVLLVLESSVGKRIGAFARYPSETEVLIPVGAKFIVTRVERNTIYMTDANQ